MGWKVEKALQCGAFVVWCLRSNACIVGIFRAASCTGQVCLGSGDCMHGRYMTLAFGTGLSRIALPAAATRCNWLLGGIGPYAGAVRRVRVRALPGGGP